DSTRRRINPRGVLTLAEEKHESVVFTGAVSGLFVANHPPPYRIFFRLTFNQAGGLYMPLITIMMIQVCTFSPNGVKAPTVTMFVMVASMV
ncbi:hypothetical protein P9431_26835, partial [Escherichia coli]|uniref:hypothetical protein n=1 Tax=Escherichia coli TaxID=562 RepID=UPI00398B2DAB